MAVATCVATALERRRPLPVDRISSDPPFTSTHAITIDAPPDPGPINYAGFDNAGGWGPAIVADFPPTIWFLFVSVILIRRGIARPRVVPIRAAIASGQIPPVSATPAVRSANRGER